MTNRQMYELPSSRVRSAAADTPSPGRVRRRMSSANQVAKTIATTAASGIASCATITARLLSARPVEAADRRLR